jgi:uncharacterized radical SAM superfamily Fe-S cluster-containing enzyme
MSITEAEFVEMVVNRMIATTSDALDNGETSIDVVQLILIAQIYTLTKRMSPNELAETHYRIADAIVAGRELTRIEDLLQCLK